MTDRNEALVREAYEAYGRGDVAGMMEFVDPKLEWTYLDPAFGNPEPQTCHGRDQLQWALERQAGQGLASQIEEKRRRCAAPGPALPAPGSGLGEAPPGAPAPSRLRSCRLPVGLIGIAVVQRRPSFSLLVVQLASSASKPPAASLRDRLR